MKQAERMVKRSRLINVPCKIGDNVTVPVPLVDRGRGDSRNIMGIIVDRDESDLYRIAVKGGILHGKFSRNQFDLCNQILLLPSDVCQDTEISLRSAFSMSQSVEGKAFLSAIVPVYLNAKQIDVNVLKLKFNVIADVTVP